MKQQPSLKASWEVYWAVDDRELLQKRHRDEKQRQSEVFYQRLKKWETVLSFSLFQTKIKLFFFSVDHCVCFLQTKRGRTSSSQSQSSSFTVTFLWVCEDLAALPRVRGWFRVSLSQSWESHGRGLNDTSMFSSIMMSKRHITGLTGKQLKQTVSFSPGAINLNFRSSSGLTLLV